ncbi:MAG TPA: TonB-dependent receptor [Steroidobacteraceae bacterium]|jgi:iron complex outermembrane receptor protein
MSELGNRRNHAANRSHPLIRAAVHAATLAALCAATSAVQAQQAPADTGDENAPLQEVIVTGTMIKRSVAETTEAITILKTDDLKDQGVVNMEQVLNTLTSSTPVINVASSVGTFTGGGTYANLRNLGQGRTLILLDGQRLANNANSGDAVDLSGVPFSAIGSVEVLREGASALYGSDAIAGVINFITKKNYQGAEFQANFDHPEKAGGASGEADFTFGHGDLMNDGYNFMLTASYSKQQELRATQRGFSADGFDPARGVTNTNYYGSWPGVVLDANQNIFQSGYPACAGNPQLTTYYGDCSYRYSAATDLLPQSSEYSGMASFTKALPGNNTVQLQYFYAQSVATGYSGPMFYQFTMDPASPYFPTPAQLTCDRGAANCGGLAPDLADPIDAAWSDPGNNRYNGTINVEQRALLTFAGTNSGWDYTTSLNYSKNTNDNRNTGGYPNEDVLDPGGVLSDLINPFGPQSAAGQALIDSSYINGVYALGEDSRWSIDGHATHPLGDAFNAGTPATVALGFDFGGERFAYATTPYNDLTAAATGLTDSTVEGSRQTQALFVELDLPILKTLDLDISDREDRYSDFGRTNNAKVAVRYQPTSFLTVRGTASTGFRAPTLFDLYSSNYLAASSSGTIGQGNPFCQPGSYNAEFTPTTCNAQGLALRGGNRTLTPETSQNFDLGVIFSPIRDLGITLDYYRILLKNTIGTIPTSAIYGDPTTFSNYYVTNDSGGLTPTVNEAANCLPYTEASCGYIVRTNQNTGRITTDGIDLSIQYVEHTPFGTFREDLEGTAITQFVQQQYNNGPLLNLVGDLQIIELPPAFRWQHNLRVDWTSPQGMFGGGLSNRFYSRYIDEYPDGNGNQRMVGSYSLVDGYVSVKPIAKLTVLFGIKNLFDRNPPYSNASQNNFAAGYNALVADPLLRNFYVNLKYTL